MSLFEPFERSPQSRWIYKAYLAMAIDGFFDLKEF